ncbi:uncharacterized protein LOC135152152 [Daucus carota subsp. sativus]|uniref:uncharacterized protein LOC135152152 n=1 Tax=Daucus carota subsp. sativus TaxID=79200 RepID=UPI003083A89E
MHTRSSGTENLIPLDPEIEATARKQSGEQRRNKNKETMGEEVPAKSLREYGMPDTTGVMSSILRPAVTATHFELKPQFIQFISNDSFAGLASENPVDHLESFLQKCDMIKLTNVPDDAIKLRLFPFSLRDAAKDWLKDEGPNKFTTWDALAKAFLLKFFSQKKTAKLRNDISNFHQDDDESLHDAWKRFKRLQRQCPHHGIPDWLLIQTFYNGLTQEFRIFIDAASGGSVMAKSTEEARTLLDEMASNDNYPYSDRNQSKKGGKYEVDSITMLNTTMQAVVKKIEQLDAKIAPTVASCEICGVQGHNQHACQNNLPDAAMEQANALYNQNQRQQYNPYSNTYNPGWRDHPNFSYKNNQANPPQNNFSHPPGFQQGSSQNATAQPPKSNLESLLEGFMVSQTQINRDMQAQNRMLETSVAQMDLQLNQLTKSQGQLPGQTEQPPKGHINAVTLRSGKELQEPELSVNKSIVDAQEDGEGSMSEIVTEKKALEEEKKEPVVPIAPYVPPVLFPQRLAKAKLKKKYGKFLDILQKLHINIPFMDAIVEMPCYAKFLKDILSRKRKIEETSTISLTAECSAILQNTFPKKLV